jgi:arylsulfatase A-like enzyme
MSRYENAVVVIVDALRADRVGAFGSERDLTPNLDDLAADGTAFENAFACATNTDPSVTSLLTGRYPLHTVYHHGKLVTTDEKRRIEGVSTLPEVLSDSGLETIATGQGLGRWHPRGFDRYPRQDSDADDGPTVADRLKRLFGRLDSASPRLGAAIRSVYDTVTTDAEGADRFASRVVQDDHDPTAVLSAVDDGPFFGVVHLMETHMPYLGLSEDFEELWATYDYPTESLEAYFKGVDVTDEQYDRVSTAMRYLGVDRPGELVALYDASVRYADRKVGQLVDELQRTGRWEDTALFVLADHGESLLEHGIYLDHHGLYDEVLCVPLVTNVGDRSDTVSELVQLTDVAPTVCDLLDVDGPELDGDSLVPLLEGTDDWSGREAVFAEEAYTQRYRCVRTADWKLIDHVADEAIEAERGSSRECGYCETVHGAERQLYDLPADPQEQENVAGDHPDVAGELAKRHEAFVADLVPAPAVDERVDYADEDEVLERLEAIGYK